MRKWYCCHRQRLLLEYLFDTKAIGGLHLVFQGTKAIGVSLLGRIKSGTGTIIQTVIVIIVSLKAFDAFAGYHFPLLIGSTDLWMFS